MPDIVKRVQYFYTEVPDKPGEGARILTMLREAGVNLLAYSGFPKGRRAQLDFIPADVAAFRAAARKGKLNLVGPKTGFLIHGEDRPGALAELIAKLAEAQINVTACEAVAAGEGRYGAILWVKPQDVQRAAKVLGAGKEARPTAAEGGVGASPATPDDSAAA
jgi:prephenate dehydratase